MSTNHFPNELLELFIDEVAKITNRAHRASALKSCALASTCISKQARSHMFSHISLRWTNKRGMTVVMKERSSVLKQLMEADPILITFIRIFEVHINDCSDGGLQEEYGLPAIITRLYSSPRSRLHSFSLSSFKFRFTPWDSLPTQFRAALSNLCSSGSLKSLSLIHLHAIPLRLITKCHTNLQQLSLFHTTFHRSCNFPPLETGRTSFAHLEGLHTDYSIFYLERLLEGEQNGILSGLRELHSVVGNQDDADGYWKIVQTSSNSLRDLRLSLKPRHPGNTLQNVQIGLLTHLCTLSFHISCSDYDDWIAATRTFSFLRSSHSGSLIHLSIDLLVYLTKSPHDYFIHNNLGWGLLDEAIASPSYPSLESVKIRLISPGLVLTNVSDAGVLDEDRWDIAVRDLSPVAMASFPRTALRMCGAPTMELTVKLLLLDRSGG